MQKMVRRPILALGFVSFLTFAAPAIAQISAKSKSAAIMSLTRRSPLDLEVGGDLVASPSGSTRYISRENLLALPQVTYTVDDDANFESSTLISGVPLELLASYLSAEPESEMVTALCSDRYQANYPHAYIAAHHPLLVLKVNGQPPGAWPKDSEARGFAMGPYIISHPKFEADFRIHSHSDEPQIPWGVVRLEFHNEATAFSTIAPRGPRAGSPQVQDGFRIAQQNCFRCHNMGNDGGQKAGRPWQVLAVWATASPEYFAAYVRNPKSKNPKSQMLGNPNYDDATIEALLAYFRTFPAQEKP